MGSFTTPHPQHGRRRAHDRSRHAARVSRAFRDSGWTDRHTSCQGRCRDRQDFRAAETYSNGVRKAVYRDLDGNELGFGGAPLDADSSRRNIRLGLSTRVADSCARIPRIGGPALRAPTGESERRSGSGGGRSLASFSSGARALIHPSGWSMGEKGSVHWPRLSESLLPLHVHPPGASQPTSRAGHRRLRAEPRRDWARR